MTAEIKKTLDVVRSTVLDAEARTGIAAADFSRIRQDKIDRFDRDIRAKVSVSKRPPSPSQSLPLAA